MKILVLNGPNLNMLGIRDQKHYGIVTLLDINKKLSALAKKQQVTLQFSQSNHEGELIDIIQQHRTKVDGILINAGALTHYGYALRDALADAKLPVVEIHLSNIHAREEFRKQDVLADIVVGGVFGFKENSYLLGLEALIGYIIKLKPNHK